MRVLIISLYFTPEICSDSPLMLALAEDLNGLGHEVTILTSVPHYTWGYIKEPYENNFFYIEEFDRFTVIRIWVYTTNRRNLFGRIVNYFSFFLLGTIAGILYVKDCDVIIVYSPPPTNGLLAYILSRIKRVPFIYMIQDLYPDVLVNLGIVKNKSLISFIQEIEKFYYRKAEFITVISKKFYELLLRRGVPKEKIFIIPNCVDVNLLKPLSKFNEFSIQKKLHDKFVIMYAGNIGFSQGLETVLESASVLSDVSDIVFVIIGEGANKISLMNKAEKIGLRNIIFMPFEPEERVPQVFSSADIMLVTLKKGISMNSVPAKLLSIMACGKPVIGMVDKGSDTWKIINQSKCGLTVEPGNSKALTNVILYLYKNKNLLKEFSANARQYAISNFSRKNMSNKYNTILKLISKHK